ncbi:hypothetical protein ACX4MY_00075 [Roseomonas mucosa]|uniref:hypothetical protein n=1 Tax=Roseomonas mucosa TaxID=207340 RepID=UPI001DEEF45F|nr:hypothetical protein [Roseomonas mucosa]MBS5905137.1 hypothetical protein [Acetobacteraceae bacterium]MDT8292003.1 hypothetical protein [Roseomonas mucosa]MDT8352422.1 hypothetical protein [Roseomonas mucosa]
MVTISHAGLLATLAEVEAIGAAHRAALAFPRSGALDEAERAAERLAALAGELHQLVRQTRAEMAAQIIARRRVGGAASGDLVELLRLSPAPQD